MARQLLNFMKAKKRGRCKCLALSMRRCGEFCSYCGCSNDNPPTPVDYEEVALDTFENSTVYANATDKDAALASATTIVETAGENGLKPFYDAVEAGNTFEAYVTEQSLAVDETGTCDDVLIANDAAFTLYVSAMGAIDCKYLALDLNDELVNATEIDAYLATIQ